jgi:pimeloyl-ACP methyl ester carboxylesterase
MWDEQIEDLTDRYRLIMWDLPGHGLSKAPTRRTDRDDLTAAMARILDAASVDRAVLVGLGVGGALTLRLWRACPDRVAAMVLIGTMPGLRSAAAREIWNAHVARLAAALDNGGLDALEGGAEVDPRLHHGPLALAHAARVLLHQSDEGALPWLAEIDTPVLILVGSEDRPNRTAADHMARIIPGARLVVIPRANHAVNVHRPAAANTAIRDFLERLPTRADPC